jgi:hypothetical protein
MRTPKNPNKEDAHDTQHCANDACSHFGRLGDELSLAFCNSNGEDVNADGLLDLVCHFNTKLTGFLAGDAHGTLKGKTIDGLPFMGTDFVRIIN